MREYLEKFRDLAIEISNNPKMILLCYKEYKAISSSDFHKLEEELSFEIDESIKSFYQIINGLELRWIHVEDNHFDVEKHIPFNLPNDISELQVNEIPIFDFNNEDVSGSINIKGVLEVFQEDFPSNPELIEDGYYIFDAFSGSCAAAFSFPTFTEKAMVTIGNEYEYFGDYDNHSQFFDKYLDFLIETKGIKCLRNDRENLKIFKNKGINVWSEEFIWNE